MSPSQLNEATDDDSSACGDGVVVVDCQPTYEVSIDVPQIELTPGCDDTVSFPNFEPELQIEVLPKTGWMSFAQGTPKVVMVTNASTVLLMPNVKRQYASFVNNTLSPVYLEFQNNAVYGRGIPLPPNTIYEIELINLFLGQVNAICVGSNAVPIDVKEGVK